MILTMMLAFVPHQVKAQTGNFAFTEQPGINLAGVMDSSVKWGDYDNDGHPDILLAGLTDLEHVAKVYRNNGDNSFVEQIQINLIGGDIGSVDWGDYDNDRDLDILLTGYTTIEGYVAKIYRNNGDNTFTEQTEINLTPVCYSAAAWADYDNDGRLDILLTGQSGEWITRIYHNNGDNTFTEIPEANLIGVHRSAVDWGDYDNDGDMDILLTGYGAGGHIVSKIYRNNSHGFFAELSGINLPGVYDGSVEWGDYDNDGNLDFVLTGSGYAAVHRNNGDGTFSEQTSFGLTGVADSSAAWGDLDNDGDLDLVLTGSGMSKIYRNDGLAGFVEQTDISLPGVSNGGIALGDYDGDGDLDLLLTGDGSEGKIAKVFRNDSSIPNMAPSVPDGLNALVEGTAVTLSWNKSIDLETSQNGISYNLEIGTTEASADIFSPMAALATGQRTIIDRGNAGQNTCWRIQNLAPGTYYWRVQAIDAAFAGSVFSEVRSFTVADITIPAPTIVGAPLSQSVYAGGEVIFVVEATGGEPLQYQWYKDGSLIDGVTGATLVITAAQMTDAGSYYVVVSNAKGSITSPEARLIVGAAPGPFSFLEQPAIKLAGVMDSSVKWGDYDNDGHLDILLAGFTGFEHVAKIYRNIGDNSFAEQTQINLIGGDIGSVDWGDYDNDGDLDILLTGYTDIEGYVAKIYRNNGDNTFAEQTQINLTPVCYSDAAWADYDNDGRLDILLTGQSGEWITKMYHNNGDNTFTEIPEANLIGVHRSAVDWGDYDGDGDRDILLTGYAAGGEIVSKVYRNDGGGFFAELSGVNLPGVYDGSVEWGDYDNDGKLDFVLTGSGYAAIHRNNGDGTFSEQTSFGLTGIADGSVTWGDLDNDGDLDLVLAGSGMAKIYRNDGENGFTEQTAVGLTGVTNTAIALGDYDADGDLDLLLTGEGTSGRIARIYRNDVLIPNTAPSAPGGLYSSVSETSVTLGWSQAADQETPQNGLTYNLRIGTGIAAADILSPMADPASGRRMIVDRGNVDENTNWTIHNLAPGTYYWSVQAIDSAFAGSAYSVTQSFTVTDGAITPPTIYVQPLSQSVSAGAEAAFTVQAAGDEPLQYQWFKNGLEIVGAVSASLSLHNVQNADAGSYTVVVTNGGGTAASDSAVLTVLQASPTIITPPASITVAIGQSATFSVTAIGTEPMTYQWRKNGVDIGGATDVSLVLTNIQPADAGNYRVVVSNMAGSVTSVAAALTVIRPPEITTQPVDVTIRVGQNATLRVVATGTAPLTYQWRKDGNSIPGANSAAFTITAAQSTDAGSYDVVVSNAAGAVTSTAAALTVNVPPTILLPPVSRTAAVGQTIVFTVEAAGTPPFSYQWRKNGVDIVGATDVSLVLTNIQPADAGNYRVVVSNIAGSVTSTAAALTVIRPPEITTQPVAITIRIGQNATFRVVATGTTPLAYQWRKNGINIAGASGATFTVTAAQSTDAGSYDVVVSNAAGAVTSSAATLTVNMPPIITTSPVSQTAAVGQTIVFTVEAAGTPPFSYQWRKNGVDIVGATDVSLVLTNIQPADAGNYRVAVSNMAGSVTSVAAALTVIRPPEITTQPVDVTIRVGQNATLRVVAAGTAPLTYQWRKDGNPVAGANSATFRVMAAQPSDAGGYDVVVSNAAGSETSATALLTVSAP